MMKKILILTVLLLIILLDAPAESMFNDAEELLLNNQLSEAALMFEAVIENEPANEKAYLYLEYMYEVKSNYSSAVSVLSKGLDNGAVMKDKFVSNIENNHFK